MQKCVIIRIILIKEVSEMGEIKPVLVDVDEDLWREAKIQALREKMALQDWVAKALQNELQRSTVRANSSTP